MWVTFDVCLVLSAKGAAKKLTFGDNALNAHNASKEVGVQSPRRNMLGPKAENERRSLKEILYLMRGGLRGKY